MGIPGQTSIWLRWQTRYQGRGSVGWVSTSDIKLPSSICLVLYILRKLKNCPWENIITYNNVDKFLDLTWAKQHERSNRRCSGRGGQDHPPGQGQKHEHADGQVRGERSESLFFYDEIPISNETNFAENLRTHNVSQICLSLESSLQVASRPFRKTVKHVWETTSLRSKLSESTLTRSKIY